MSGGGGDFLRWRRWRGAGRLRNALPRFKYISFASVFADQVQYSSSSSFVTKKRPSRLVFLSSCLPSPLLPFLTPSHPRSSIDPDLPASWPLKPNTRFWSDRFIGSRPSFFLPKLRNTCNTCEPLSHTSSPLFANSLLSRPARWHSFRASPTSHPHPNAPTPTSRASAAQIPSDLIRTDNNDNNNNDTLLFGPLRPAHQDPSG